MASDPSMKLSVDRLENDVESIYELIGDFRFETRGQFEGIGRTLAELLRRLPAS